MSRYKWLPRGAPKKPDEFVSAVDSALRFVLARKGIIFSLLFLMGLAGVAGWAYVRKLESDKFDFRKALVSARESADSAGALGQLLKRFGKETPGGLIHLELMSIHDQKGEWDQAATELDLAYGLVPSFLKAPLLLSKARLIWQMKGPDEASDFIDQSLAASDEILRGDLESLKGKILGTDKKEEIQP